MWLSLNLFLVHLFKSFHNKRKFFVRKSYGLIYLTIFVVGTNLTKDETIPIWANLDVVPCLIVIDSVRSFE